MRFNQYFIYYWFYSAIHNFRYTKVLLAGCSNAYINMLQEITLQNNKNQEISLQNQRCQPLHIRSSYYTFWESHYTFFHTFRPILQLNYTFWQSHYTFFHTFWPILQVNYTFWQWWLHKVRLRGWHLCCTPPGTSEFLVIRLNFSGLAVCSLLLAISFWLFAFKGSGPWVPSDFFWLVNLAQLRGK